MGSIDDDAKHKTPKERIEEILDILPKNENYVEFRVLLSLWLSRIASNQSTGWEGMSPELEKLGIAIEARRFEEYYRGLFGVAGEEPSTLTVDNSDEGDADTVVQNLEPHTTPRATINELAAELCSGVTLNIFINPEHVSTWEAMVTDIGNSEVQDACRWIMNRFQQGLDYTTVEWNAHIGDPSGDPSTEGILYTAMTFLVEKYILIERNADVLDED